VSGDAGRRERAAWWKVRSGKWKGEGNGMNRRGVTELPVDYPSLLEDIKRRIRSAQIRAALSVNRELIRLYWDIGKTIVQRQQAAGWGKSTVERLAADIQREFPGIAGFSPQNVWFMRAFYLAWTRDVQQLQQPVRESELSKNGDLPQAVRDIPWGHNIQLISKIKAPAERLWYAQQTITHGWSRSMLEHWIESDLYSRQGKAVTNFKETMPLPQSDLALQVLKDPYNFDFLTLREDAIERDLEDGLTGQMMRFLLELGEGFAFVGRQVPLRVDREDFYIDLLFYHLNLRAFVVIDLKARKFVPEDAGKMNFYLSAVDDLMRKPGDAPSIGLILCKDRSRIIAEYALRYLNRPVGVAGYLTRLTEKLPKELQGKLPTVKQIEAELSGDEMGRKRVKRK